MFIYMNIYRYPKSKLLGNLPCGKNATSNDWLKLGAPYNTPVYPNAPNENCGKGGCEVTGTRFKDADNELVLTRETLKKGNNRVIRDHHDLDVTPVNTSLGITPFRAMMNAGDPSLANNKYTANNKLAYIASSTLNADKIYYNAINQVSSVRRASNRAAVKMSGYLPRANVNSLEDAKFSPDGGASVALWTGNTRFVYDGSDYVKFKKLQANNRNFNDITYGGDRNNASQVAKARVRR